MLQRKLALSEILMMEKATISEEDVRKKNVVVIPATFGGKDVIQAPAIAPTKEIMSKAGNSIIAYRGDDHRYSDFRGGEYEFPLFILKEIVLPIFTAVLSSWIYDKIKEYRKEKEAQPENSLVKEPTIKVRGYITEDSKYFEIEGTATQVAKEISEQFTREKKNGK